MDSVTQVVLGAAVGEAIAGKKIGNKAMVWGAIAGTIPDLDVITRLFLDAVDQLSAHRGFTHSFLFAFIFAPSIAWLFSEKIFKNSSMNFKDWFWIFFLGFITHIFLDSFTTWGTQLFYPFSNYGVAFYTISVIDPAYTIPFLGLLIWTALLPKLTFNRRLTNFLGFTISTYYLLILATVNKNIAHDVFEKNLSSQGIKYERTLVKPMPGNIAFWSMTATTEKGFYIGYHSLFESDHKVSYEYVEKHDEYLGEYKNHPKVKRLLEITKGFYTISKTDYGIIINDLRFGTFNGWLNGEDESFIFRYKVEGSGNNLSFETLRHEFKSLEAGYTASYWKRILGNKNL